MNTLLFRAWTRGPYGDVMTLADLPPPDIKRWVASRKAQIVLAVRAGMISRDEALARYNLSSEEFSDWERRFQRGGLHGLKVTRLRQYVSPWRAGRSLG